MIIKRIPGQARDDGGEAVYKRRIMKILVTDAKSFVGRNLCAQLRNIRNRKAPLVTIMWANEIFDPKRPDTYAEPV